MHEIVNCANHMITEMARIILKRKSTDTGQYSELLSVMAFHENSLKREYNKKQLVAWWVTLSSGIERQKLT